MVNKILTHKYQQVVLIALGWPNMPWFWDLWLSSQIPLCLPLQPNLLTQPFNRSLHRDLSNLNIHTWLFGSPPRSSTRAVYEAKWAVFVRTCKVNQVDFLSPSINQIADFLLHLFQDKALRPSTIDGYRSSVTDKIGNLPSISARIRT